MLLWRTFSSIRRVFSYAGRAHPLRASPSQWRLLIIWAAKDSTPPNPQWLRNNHNDDGKNWDHFTSLKWILEPQSSSCSCVNLRLVDVETVIVGYRLLKCDFKRVGTVTTNQVRVVHKMGVFPLGNWVWTWAWLDPCSSSVDSVNTRASCSGSVRARVFWKGSLVHGSCVLRHGTVEVNTCPIVSKTGKCTTVVFDGPSRLSPKMAAHRRCWRSKVGWMVVVGDSKVRNNMSGNNSDSSVHGDALNCWFLLLLQTDSLHIATYCVGQCTPCPSAQPYQCESWPAGESGGRSSHARAQYGTVVLKVKTASTLRERQLNAERSTNQLSKPLNPNKKYLRSV